MTTDPIVIAGLSVPDLLVAAVKRGRWIPPREERIYLDVFADPPAVPEFYYLAQMERETLGWRDTEFASIYSLPIEGVNLGVEPEKVLIIGDLGPDMPFALDYRVSPREPRVIYLGADGWIEVAISFSDLASRLQISSD